MTPRFISDQTGAPSARAEAYWRALPSRSLTPPEMLQGRFPVIDVEPVVESGRRAAKASVDEVIPIRATVFREGHDLIGVTCVVTDPDGAHTNYPMQCLDPGLDGWGCDIRPDSEGMWTFTLEAWADPVATWRHRAEVKVPAGVDVDLELEEGARVLERALEGIDAEHARAAVEAAIELLRDESRSPGERLDAALTTEVRAALEAFPLRDLVTPCGPWPLMVSRNRALFGSWYEFFPRSEGATTNPPRSGTFRTAAERLPELAHNGFDVIYLPPIHPIGYLNRKGRNNSLQPAGDDPGSPWAIGSHEGGHDAVHPELGTLEDFDHFVAAARALDMEVALDLALQAAPDHPWATEGRPFFTILADGTIAYAENPPKKYQDIYPLWFDEDPAALHAEVLRITRFWMERGVRIFRVDNPHTKPVPFWERLIGEIHDTDPDVIFLAEAFTRPPVMRTLGEIGFDQSYTYFTWRNDKQEFEDYLRELSGPAAAYMRPNFFVNTPDILNSFLQYGGPAAFAIRATLAATSSPTWGMYAGFELYEHVAVKPGSEEYLDSEKFQLRPRDWAALEAEGKTLTPHIAKLNRLRREHPALRQLRNIRFHTVSDDKITCFSKTDGEDTVIVVCTMDPYGPREGTVTLDLMALGMHDEVGPLRFTVHDELSGESWVWGQENYVRLDPRRAVAHVLTVRRGLV